MKKIFNYELARFSVDVLREAADELFKDINLEGNTPSLYVSVELDDGIWYHDTEEEFFNDYNRSKKSAEYEKNFKDYSFYATISSLSTIIRVKAPIRAKIQSVFNILDRNLEISKIPELTKLPIPKPIVFIGHGKKYSMERFKRSSSR